MTQRQVDLYTPLLKYIEFSLESFHVKVLDENLNHFILLKSNQQSLKISYEHWQKLLELKDSIELSFELVGGHYFV